MSKSLIVFQLIFLEFLSVTQNSYMVFFLCKNAAQKYKHVIQIIYHLFLWIF